MYGKGIYNYADGTTYIGKFKDGKKEGKGILKWVNGNTYEGEFKFGKMKGEGIYT